MMRNKRKRKIQARNDECGIKIFKLSNTEDPNHINNNKLLTKEINKISDNEIKKLKFEDEKKSRVRTTKVSRKHLRKPPVTKEETGNQPFQFGRHRISDNSCHSYTSGCNDNSRRSLQDPSTIRQAISQSPKENPVCNYFCRVKKCKEAEDLLSLEISPVVSCTRTSHASYDIQTAKYIGLPNTDEEIQKGINQQYNVPYSKLPKVNVKGYQCPIAGVIVMLKTSLMNLDAFKTEGIFRKEGNFQILEEMKKQINDGNYTGCEQPHILAGLFKQFIRGLPGGLFNIIPIPIIEKHSKETWETIPALMTYFNKEYYSLLLYLLDTFIEIIEHQDINFMSDESIATVMAPNFYVESTNVNDMEYFHVIQMLIPIMNMIKWRENTKESDVNM